jgi:SagB-type dehydrogenase family enzyme
MTRRDLSYLVSLALGVCAFYVTISGVIMDVRDVPGFVLHTEAGYACVVLGLAHLALNWPLVRSYLRRWRRPRPGPGADHALNRRRRSLVGAALAAVGGAALGFVVGRLTAGASPRVLDVAPTDQEETPQPRTAAPLRSMALPPPAPSSLALGEAIRKRRSRRTYGQTPLTLEELSTVLFAAQGITDTARGLRAAPSAGALYPLETYSIVHRVQGLAPGLYHYRPSNHTLALLDEQELGGKLTLAGVGQLMLARAGAVIVFSAVYARTTRRYGARSERYILLEAGHAAQNIYLAAEGAGLAACAVGAFDDRALNAILGLDGQYESALYMMTLGRA